MKYYFVLNISCGMYVKVELTFSWRWEEEEKMSSGGTGRVEIHGLQQTWSEFSRNPQLSSSSPPGKPSISQLGHNILRSLLYNQILNSVVALIFFALRSLFFTGTSLSVSAAYQSFSVIPSPA